METTPGLFDGRRVRAENPAAVAVFFETLRREQVRFLDAVGRARSELGRESGQLAHVTAIQARLTRLFFDAQTAIMRRRAEVDAEVVAIAEAAEALAAATVGTAREQVAHGLAPRLLHPAGGHAADMLSAQGAPRTPRQEIAALSVSVVTTTEEAAALRRLLEEAFQPDDPDAVAAERALTAVLEEWWRAEQQEGRAVLDDAHARAMMRTHLAEVEAREILLTAPVEPSDGDQAGVADGADGAAPHDVEPDLARVDVPVIPPESLAITAPVIRLDASPVDLPPSAPRREEPLRPFWDADQAPPPARHRWWNSTSTLLPATVATGVIALLMMWVG